MIKLFEGMEKFGLDNLKDVSVYEEAKPKSVTAVRKKIEEPEQFLYMKVFGCPVCERPFEERMVRRSKLRHVSTEDDLKPNFAPINPMYYDVIMCTHCGYAALGLFFGKLKEVQAEAVKEKISTKFKAQQYPFVLTLDQAIERHKLALLNAAVAQVKSSEKAYICMKLGWLYREKSDVQSEKMFLEYACRGFIDAHTNENMPICGMDEYTVSFLIASFYKQAGKPSEAMKWLGNIIIKRSVGERLRQRAINLKQEIQQEAKNADNKARV